MAADQNVIDPTRRRQATVVARDPATGTCSVNIGGDTDPDHTSDGVVSLPGYVPRVGDTVWVLQVGSDPLIIGGLGTELPKVKIQTTGTQTATGTLTQFTQFGTGVGGSTAYDTDGMADRVNDQIVIQWPGKYVIGFKAWFTSNGNLERKIAEIRLNGTRVGRIEIKTDTDLGDTWTDERLCAVGDTFELWISSITANATFGINDELGIALWASYQP